MAIEIHFRDRRLGPIVLLSSRADRIRGLRGLTDIGVLLYGRSVHSFGLTERLAVVFLTAAGRVLRTVVLPPGRIVCHRPARLVLEFPPSWGLPAVGEVATAYARLDGRSTHPVRDSDRKPG